MARPGPEPEPGPVPGARHGPTPLSTMPPARRPTHALFSSRLHKRRRLQTDENRTDSDLHKPDRREMVARVTCL